MQKITFLFSLLFILSCSSNRNIKSNNLQLKFLDEYILSENIVIDNTVVGGLSGIDFHQGLYYMVCDDPRNPRYYEAKINIDNSKISNIDFQKVIQLQDTNHYLDLESIIYNSKTNQIVLTSEGNIKKHKDPQLLSVDLIGNLKKKFQLPKALKANSLQKPRHNGTLEGLSKSADNKGYWIAMELPLEVDGPEPKLIKTKSPVRITYIDDGTKQPKKQFGYLLDKIIKQPKGNFAVNGLTDILAYDTDKFFIIERSYSSGLGNQGNTVKIFKVDASNATNILTVESLKTTNYTAANKELVFDFEQVRNQLTDNSIDNIEGITFGPTLPNGNKTLILVSDNNFNRFEKQLNQFILLEIIN